MKYTNYLILACSVLTSACSSASFMQRDPDGLTPLHLAAGRGDRVAVKNNVMGGADVNALDAKMGVSVLHKAVYSGQSEVVSYLLDQGALIDLQSPSNGDTPLHDAIYFKNGNDWSVIRAILSHHPNLTIKNRAGLTPRESALAIHDQKLASLLDDALKARHTDLGVQLMTAVKENNFSKTQSLLSEPKIDIQERDDAGFTPLLWASRQGYSEIVGLLLAKGANPNGLDEWMQANAGHKAAFWGRTEVMKRLIRAHLNVNAQGGYNGYTALHDAVAQERTEVVQILLAAGARIDIAGHDGKTALDLARTHQNPDILKWMNLSLKGIR